MKSLSEPSELKDFIDRALPGSESGHVLAVGESHKHRNHLDCLRKNLSHLAEYHNLRAIGLELAPFMNVFFWAYRDGRLPVPEEKHNEYLQTLCTHYNDPRYHHNAVGRAEFLIAGLENENIERIVACDTRLLLEHMNETYSRYRDAIEKALEIESQKTGHPIEEIENAIRNDISVLWTIGQKNAGLYSDIHQFSLELSWILREAGMLLAQHPDYARRLGAMEEIARLGKSEHIDSDALSAALLHAASGQNGNLLYIGGVGHLCGIRSSTKNLQGIFDVSLKAATCDDLPPRSSIHKLLLSDSIDLLQMSGSLKGGKIGRVRSIPFSTFDPLTGAPVYNSLAKSHNLLSRPEQGQREIDINPLADPRIADTARRVNLLENQARTKTCGIHVRDATGIAKMQPTMQPHRKIA